MTAAVLHRGPDQGGAWFAPERGLALGHRRLSIIDLSEAGTQPMQSASGRLVIVFNGEIYNHLSLRERLERQGEAPEWRGRSDTETLLAAIEAWGLDAALRESVGMFALAVWDKRDQRLHLARDRFGEKPLYYGWTDGGRAFVFGSELKVLRAYPGFDNALDREAAAMFFRHTFVPTSHCIFQGLRKVVPGGVVEITEETRRSRAPAQTQFWNVEASVRHAAANRVSSEAEGLEALERALREAVRLQACADVPLGAFLSGGVDSSTIVALMQAQSSQRVKTFTVGFDMPGFDESVHARAVAAHLGTDHHEMRVSPRDAMDVIPRLPALYDEPFADSSQIPTHLVCKAARTHVTVALSGDAGDELFCGYNRHLWWPTIRERFLFAPPIALKIAAALITGVSPAAFDRLSRAHPRTRDVPQFGDKVHKLAHRLSTIHDLRSLHESLLTEWTDRERIVKGAPDRLSLGLPALDDIPEPQHRMMLWDTMTYLTDDILTKVDRAAMGTSLETRVPFLDHRVFEAAWRLPLDMKLRNGQSKWALRQILYKYVPKEMIERPKAGFAIPVGEWLRGPLRDWAEDLLSPSRLAGQGILEEKPVREAWRQHLTGRHDWTPKLWSVLMFQAWMDAYG